MPADQPGRDGSPPEGRARGAAAAGGIDEAQWLNRECCEYLRHLHDERRTRFGLLFVGGAGCYEVLRREPMLNSRIYAQVRFAPLTLAQVVQVIPVYHDVYTDVPVELIELVDRHFAHGNFRDWAKFTQHAVRLAARVGRERLDEEIGRNVFDRLAGGQSQQGSMPDLLGASA